MSKTFKIKFDSKQSLFGLDKQEDGTYVYGIADASDKQYVQVLGEDGEYQDVCIINDVDDTPTATGVTLLTRFAICSLLNSICSRSLYICLISFSFASQFYYFIGFVINR